MVVVVRAVLGCKHAWALDAWTVMTCFCSSVNSQFRAETEVQRELKIVQQIHRRDISVLQGWTSRPDAPRTSQCHRVSGRISHYYYCCFLVNLLQPGNIILL
jgi:hypothetical protein